MYAKVSPYYRDLPFEEALSLILNDFDSRLAPEGLNTAGQIFIAIMSDSEQIGYFHFGEYPKGSKSVFGWNFHIYDQHQQKGYGTRSANLAKIFLKDLGYNKIAINVRSNNEPAIKIYRALGFQTVQLNMESLL